MSQPYFVQEYSPFWTLEHCRTGERFSVPAAARSQLPVALLAKLAKYPFGGTLILLTDAEVQTLKTHQRSEQDHDD